MTKKAKEHDPIRDIIEVASSAYPDDLILSYYEKPHKDWGDGLAQFMAREIASVCSGSDADAFDQAADALTRALDQIVDVVNILRDTAGELRTPTEKGRNANV